MLWRKAEDPARRERRRSERGRRAWDRFVGGTVRGAAVAINLLALLIALGLFLKARPILAAKPLLRIFFSSSWHPARGDFGFLPFIVGTIEVTLIAMALAAPLCLLTAVYLSEFARRRVRAPARLAMDVMAGIPSVIYGLFGVIVIVPLVRAAGNALGFRTTGYSLLAGGLVLAVMVSPVIISVATDVLAAVPRDAREAALALGATRWEAAKWVVLRTARGGVLCAVVLGFARAFGETMAVLMVVGGAAARIPQSLFDQAYPLPALIANNYGEMMSVPLYDSALMLAALILMLVVGAFNLAAHAVFLRIERSQA